MMGFRWRARRLRLRACRWESLPLRFEMWRRRLQFLRTDRRVRLVLLTRPLHHGAGLATFASVVLACHISMVRWGSRWIGEICGTHGAASASPPKGRCWVTDSMLQSCPLGCKRATTTGRFRCGSFRRCCAKRIGIQVQLGWDCDIGRN